MNRKDRRAHSNAESIGKTLFNSGFLQLLDETAKRTGTSQQKIVEILNTGEASEEDYIQIAECLILMTGLVLQ